MNHLYEPVLISTRIAFLKENLYELAIFSVFWSVGLATTHHHRFP